MNELEINKAVAEKLGYSFTNDLEGLDNQTTIYVSDEEVHNMDVDYCNRWADAGPIIEKYKIDLLFYKYDEKWSAESAVFDVPVTDHGAPITRNYEENPLKAAMLCFLEMEI